MNYKLKQSDILKIELFGKLQDELLTIYDLSLISFEHSGTAIINPFMDETNRYEVDPVEYYGESNVINFFTSILDIERNLMIDISSIPKTQILEKLINYYMTNTPEIIIKDSLNKNIIYEVELVYEENNRIKHSSYDDGTLWFFDKEEAIKISKSQLEQYGSLLYNCAYVHAYTYTPTHAIDNIKDLKKEYIGIISRNKYEDNFEYNRNNDISKEELEWDEIVDVDFEL